jgi:thiamine pyrophosphokinase
MTTANRVCVIFGAGEYYTSALPHTIASLLERGSKPLVVAADGGWDHASQYGIDADIVIGDFDSITTKPNSDSHMIRLPANHDDPDMLSALKVGWQHGAREFHIVGALGNRIDHTIANIQMMALLSQHGGNGYLYGDGSIVTAITDGQLQFDAMPAMPGTMVSVFSHSDTSVDVSEPGLKYQLKHATLTNSFVEGVSNEFLAQTPSAIEVHEGTLIVTFPIESIMPQVTFYHEFSGGLGELDTKVSSILATGAR